jgi:ABC-type uncharacterized transport system fused permease/ATPase subunit
MKRVSYPKYAMEIKYNWMQHIYGNCAVMLMIVQQDPDLVD